MAMIDTVRGDRAGTGASRPAGRFRVLGLSVGLAALAGCADPAPEPAPPADATATAEPSAPSEPATVWFIEPVAGAEVTGPDVQVVLGASGIEITPADIQRPGTGHHHIFIDRDVTPMQDTIPSGVAGVIHMGDGRSEHMILGLEPGEHRVIAVVADWAHIPLDPPVVDTIFFTVVAPPAP